MILLDTNGNVQPEAGEPGMRSCWECNPTHERLKTVNRLHTCYECGRAWVFDRFFDSFASNAEFIAWLASKGVGVGESTKKVDAGYRLMEITIGLNGKVNEAKR